MSPGLSLPAAEPAPEAPATHRVWPDGSLRSPISGAPLVRQGRALLAGGGETWPMIDDIPFLRADRPELAAAAVALIRDGDVEGATALLLRDQDPYAPDPPPEIERCRALLRAEPSLTFRTAMARLGFGPVADYFAHRWSDPTFLSGLALLEQALAGAALPVFELACGAGHFLAALARGGVAASGGDLVFAKLWLARHFIAPEARLICFDAGADWPMAADGPAAVFCHDAFYFMPDKPGIAARMMRRAGDAGVVAIGHAHNAATDNHSAGRPLAVEGYAALLPGAALFDDQALTQAFVTRRPAAAAEAPALQAAPAVSLLWRAGLWRAGVAPAGEAAPLGLGDPQPGSALQLNPLYRRQGGQRDGAARIEWPSPRYRAEYAALATYPAEWTGPDLLRPTAADADAIRRRIYLDLPERW